MKNEGEDETISNISERGTYEQQDRHRCAVCNSSSSVTQHSFTEQGKNELSICLCRKHDQIFNILGHPQSPKPAGGIDLAHQNTSKVTVRVSDALIDSADTAAQEYGQTRSELVRDALQVFIELRQLDDATSNLLSQAIQSNEDAQTHASEDNVAFLKERIRRLESLLEDSIEKI